MSHPLCSRHLYIADLARRQHEMESGSIAMQPLAYRVLSKQLRLALAGLAEPSARLGFLELPAHLLPLVCDMLETRHFDNHGRFFGPRASDCEDRANAIVGRLKRLSKS